MSLWDKAKKGFTTAFAVGDTTPLSPEDLELIEKVAGIIVRRGMASPAVIMIEGVKPLSFLGSQALAFIAPFAKMIVKNEAEYDRIVHILEKRSSVEILIRRIIELDNSTTDKPSANPSK